jgi:hypothetical protein
MCDLYSITTNPAPSRRLSDIPRGDCGGYSGDGNQGAACGEDGGWSGSNSLTEATQGAR